MSDKKTAPFEIVIIKVERSRRFVENILYDVRNYLNANHAPGGIEDLRFIVIPHQLHDTYYLAFRTASLGEANTFRDIAVTEFEKRYKIGQAKWLKEKKDKEAKEAATKEADGDEEGQRHV